ncbi:hypothetical protein PIB30_016507 [Stylosanthes scabra]|uniref:Uncharacterized protein n=1 Tax=Stylosanthes scabra TaxID=79078 RepID=A0ABU6Z7Q1_9FABA|nr:hypothetical protein [Stylosanthes scabra]
MELESLFSIMSSHLSSASLRHSSSTPVTKSLTVNILTPLPPPTRSHHRFHSFLVNVFLFKVTTPCKIISFLISPSHTPPTAAPMTRSSPASSRPPDLDTTPSNCFRHRKRMHMVTDASTKARLVAAPQRHSFLQASDRTTSKPACPSSVSLRWFCLSATQVNKPRLSTLPA